ncbi:hypothetical protein EUGRSUZ_C01091 [Eucalyptus grandis]|uniref:Uncharacterized protein n=2 Tax=Eucalyptus grandis TaxID=71139 RepID=A0ACC3LCK4_EUCGR|nr:hypothetical protein EUGRSUZ_C01091 [Eucalyptus grandis]
MDSISTLKLPLIDLSELDGSKPGTVQWDSLQSQVREALEEFGCFEALTDRMTLELHNDVFQEMEALLELPTDVKRRFSDPNKPYDGYRGNLPHSPLYEAFGINYAPNSGSIEGFANLIWPEGNTRFCETMKTYVTRVLELDSLVKKLVLGSLGVDKYLESLAKSGWSNGRLYSPCHRVMMSGHEARYCIGFFSNGQGTMQCPDELVDDQHPLLFKPFDVAGLFRIYKTKEGESGASAMDTYYRI